MNNLLKYFHHKFVKNSHSWYPFLSVFYLTNQCHFRCPYCCDGHETPYYKLSTEVLPFKKVMMVLRQIRKNTENLVITGGEPFNHPEVGRILNELKLLNFKQIAYTTNGYDFDKFQEEINTSITTLIFSLDTLNAEKADSIYGAGKGCFNKILKNIELAKNLKGRRYDILISSVASPENIHDIYDVLEFCKTNKFSLAVAPQLCGVKANPELSENSEYSKLYCHLMEQKKKGADIFGSTEYLKYMRDLKKFKCYPFTMLVVSPLGDVFYPCLEIGHFAGNLLEKTTLKQIRKNGLEKFGPVPDCDVRCHSACALGFSLLLSNPLKMI